MATIFYGTANKLYEDYEKKRVRRPISIEESPRDKWRYLKNGVFIMSAFAGIGLPGIGVAYGLTEMRRIEKEQEWASMNKQ